MLLWGTCSKIERGEWWVENYFCTSLSFHLFSVMGNKFFRNIYLGVDRYRWERLNSRSFTFGVSRSLIGRNQTQCETTGATVEADTAWRR